MFDDMLVVVVVVAVVVIVVGRNLTQLNGWYHKKAHLCFFQAAGDSFLVRSNTKNKRKKLPKVAQVGSFCPKIVLVFFWSHKKRFFDRRLWHGSVEIWHLRWVEKMRRLIKREREWLPWKNDTKKESLTGEKPAERNWNKTRRTKYLYIRVFHHIWII